MLLKELLECFELFVKHVNISYFWWSTHDKIWDPIAVHSMTLILVVAFDKILVSFWDLTRSSLVLNNFLGFFQNKDKLEWLNCKAQAAGACSGSSKILLFWRSDVLWNTHTSYYRERSTDLNLQIMHKCFFAILHLATAKFKNFLYC